jgi:predicted RNA binding protein YcfA (HicA-like mRNA interferase family)
MPRDRKKIEKSLLNKGFTQDAGDHRYYKYYDGNKYTGVFTFISRGSGYKVYSDSLLSDMWKQLKLNSKKELCDLIDCPMNESKYRAILKSKNLMAPSK